MSIQNDLAKAVCGIHLKSNVQQGGLCKFSRN